MNTHTGDIFVGIDVSKATLEVACAPTGEHWVVANDAPGIARLVARLVPLAPERIVLEATGGLEMPVVAALAAAKLAVVVVNPRQRRDFARAPAHWPRAIASMPSDWPPSRKPSDRRCAH
jgi:transposase